MSTIRREDNEIMEAPYEEEKIGYTFNDLPVRDSIEITPNIHKFKPI
jgi:hypothetical protein